MKWFWCLVVMLLSSISFAQKKPADSLLLMNGRIIAAPVLDTTLGAVTFVDPADTAKRAHIENEQLFAVKYHTGDVFYYYKQDTITGNWFTRDEMWMYMQGERDAQKGFKARGSLYGTMASGIVGGLSSSLVGPVLPLAYFLCTGLPKVKIKHNTVSNVNNLDYDSYLLGYERVARSKRRMRSLIGAGIGLVLGYSSYFLVLKNYY
jgi:hypothetical protein